MLAQQPWETVSDIWAPTFSRKNRSEIGFSNGNDMWAPQPWENDSVQNHSEIGFSDRKDVLAQQPWGNGSVKNHSELGSNNRKDLWAPQPWENGTVWENGSIMNLCEIGSSNRKDLCSPQPLPNSSVKTDSKLGHRRTRSEGTLFVELHPGNRKIFEELNVDDDTQGLPTKKRKLLRELNGTAHCPFSIGEINDLEPRWTVFRMLVPTMDDDVNNHYNRYPNTRIDVGDVEVYTSFVDGVGIVVMVLAKKDSRRSAVHVGNVFRALYHSFLPKMHFEGLSLIRLLVPAAHTKRLIALQTIRSPFSKLAIYLTDNITFLSSGDVIVEVEEFHWPIDETMQSVFSDLGELTVDESMVTEILSTSGIRSSNHVISECGKTSYGVKVKRDFEVRGSKLIPLSYIDYIIGKDGSNIDNIRKSTPATVFIKTSTLKEVTISIVGETQHEVEDAATLMEDLIPKHLKKDGKPVFDGLVYSSSNDERDGYALFKFGFRHHKAMHNPELVLGEHY